MIEDLDEALRQMLIRELPVRNGEVNIEFHQPKREWSSRLSRPTLNLFLHHLCENTTLRQPEWEVRRNNDGTASRRRTPVRMDLHYMITAWTSEPEDEHRLLTRTLLALYRNPVLPEDLLPESLQDQPVPIPLRIADPENLRNPADIWTALDNELRAALACVVTLALNPYQLYSGPLVRMRELRFGWAAELPLFQRLAEPEQPDRLWLVGGMVQGEGPFESLSLTLVERGLSVPIRPDGRYVIGNLEPGDYTLELAAPGRRSRRQKITVPAESYDIEP